MCLYPRLILNKKYIPNKKNNYKPPKLTDQRIKYVAVGCGECIECRKQKAHEWQIRLHEELANTELKSYFITLTFSNESISELKEITKSNDCNTWATKAVRLFLERWRKIHKRSLKHWLITELGEEHDRIHLHGIIFTNEPMNNDILHSFWKFGHTDIGSYCSNRTINYIVKYITKIDLPHKDYKNVILCSSGIGATYKNNKLNKKKHKYLKGETIEYYTLPDGNKMSLPIYYRNGLFTEDERESIWIDRIEKHTTYIRGIKLRLLTDEDFKLYESILHTMQEENRSLGYGGQHDTREYISKVAQINT